MLPLDTAVKINKFGSILLLWPESAGALWRIDRDFQTQLDVSGGIVTVHPVHLSLSRTLGNTAAVPEQDGCIPNSMMRRDTSLEKRDET